MLFNPDPDRDLGGFTLVELLAIIGVIGVLFAVILIAVDPARSFSESRDSIRRQDVRNILRAIVEYAAANDGDDPIAIDAVPGSIQLLGTSAVGCDATACAGYSGDDISATCVDMTSELVGTFIGSIPVDPRTGTASNTRYYLNKVAGKGIEVGACDPESVISISVKRQD